MKLILAIIDDTHSTRVTRALMKEGLQFTKLSSTGGFLSSGNTTLLLGVEDEKVSGIIELIKLNCERKRLKDENREVEIGTMLFVMPMDMSVRI